MARPTIYNEEMLLAARYYVDNHIKIGHPVPMVAGLAVHLGVSRETVRAWAGEEDKAEFSGIVEELRAKAEIELFSKGVTGDFNATVVKLGLGKHGYSEKQVTELTGAGGGALEVTYVGVTSGKRES